MRKCVVSSQIMVNSANLEILKFHKVTHTGVPSGLGENT